jgi:transposase-like protein
VIDLDPAWIKAVREAFPRAPVQGCVVHIERIVDRVMPKRKRTLAQEELKALIRSVLYAKTLKDSRRAFHELMGRRHEWRDLPSVSAISTILDNYSLLTAHFRAKDSYRANNITESVIDKMETKLKVVRGFKRESTAANSLRLAIMHYRFNPFLSSKMGNNGKSPLMLAGVDTRRIDWVAYSQGE